MALSDAEKAKIEEEEAFRAETRKRLLSYDVCQKTPGHGCHRCRSAFWIIVILLALGVCHGMGVFHGWCGYDRDRAYGRGGAMMDEPQARPQKPDKP